MFSSFSLCFSSLVSYTTTFYDIHEDKNLAETIRKLNNTPIRLASYTSVYIRDELARQRGYGNISLEGHTSQLQRWTVTHWADSSCTLL